MIRPDLSYMNVGRFMERIFALRPERRELRVNPSMKLEDMRLNPDCGISASAIPIVRDWRVPPHVYVVVELGSGKHEVFVIPPSVPDPTAA